jgi:hypothetical protein
MKLAMIIKDENPDQSGIRNVRLLKNRSAGCSGYRMLLYSPFIRFNVHVETDIGTDVVVGSWCIVIDIHDTRNTAEG